MLCLDHRIYDHGSVPHAIVSAVMPNYNDAATIGEAIEALLDQSFKSLEVIVVDDASTDNSVEVVKAIAKRDARVTLIRHECNRGPIYAQLTGFERAAGDYIFGPSANDKVLPGFLEKLVDCLKRHPEAGGVFCDLVCVDNEDFSVVSGVASAPAYLSPEALARILRNRHALLLGGAASLVRRSALKEAGWLIPELRWMADFFALYVIGFRHGLCHVPEPLYAIRSPAYSSAGPRSLAQREATQRLLKLLQSPEYRDVRSFFNRTGILALVPGFLSAVLGRPAFWDFLAPIALRRALWNETKNLVRPLTPAPLRRAFRNVRDRCFPGAALRCGGA